ncbi:hypothetical protein V7654_06575 [Bacillus sp. JJ1609]|uniref:hypothetical protein n=1 Tax=Bacillus sp. JJ1609 TaxID=3122977 RepID=UPI0030005E2B
MYLTKVSLWDIVKKQFRFKLKSYRGMYTSLMILQVIAILFSLGGTGGGGGSTDNFSYDLKDYSGILIFTFTLIWAFISAVVVTTHAYRNDDYAFVANRVSSHLSNILYLGLTSALGGVTVMLAGQALKLFVMFNQDIKFISSAPLTVPQIAVGVAAAIMYLFLFSALGYLAGTLVQKSRLFIVILPAALFGLLFLNVFLAKESTLLMDMGLFFINETSFLLFTLKALFTSFLSFGVAVWISNRMEVRQ